MWYIEQVEMDQTYNTYWIIIGSGKENPFIKKLQHFEFVWQYDDDSERQLDEKLHYRLAKYVQRWQKKRRILLKSSPGSSPKLFIKLFTGDGNENDGKTTYPYLVCWISRRFENCQDSVDLQVFSWTLSLSQLLYAIVEQYYPGGINYLEDLFNIKWTKNLLAKQQRLATYQCDLEIYNSYTLQELTRWMLQKECGELVDSGSYDSGSNSCSSNYGGSYDSGSDSSSCGGSCSDNGSGSCGYQVHNQSPVQHSALNEKELELFFNLQKQSSEQDQNLIQNQNPVQSQVQSPVQSPVQSQVQSPEQLEPRFHTLLMKNNYSSLVPVLIENEILSCNDFELIMNISEDSNKPNTEFTCDNWIDLISKGAGCENLNILMREVYS